MGDRNLENSLYHSLGQEIQPKRLDETIKGCTEIMREYCRRTMNIKSVTLTL